MKKLFLAACAVAVAGSVFAQGTVQFNNRLTGTLISYVYYNSAVHTQIVGNGATDTPTGTTDWTGFTKIAGAGYMAALLGATGAGVAESSLQFGATPVTSTFRTGGAAGNIVAIPAATHLNVAKDAAAATFEVFCWDNSSGNYSSPTAALTAWQAGTIAGGKSGTFTVTSIGGDLNTPPVMVGWSSFNIYSVPEPSTLALAGLGLAGMMIFRRRK